MNSHVHLIRVKRGDTNRAVWDGFTAVCATSTQSTEAAVRACAGKVWRRFDVTYLGLDHKGWERWEARMK